MSPPQVQYGLFVIWIFKPESYYGQSKNNPKNLLNLYQ